MPRMIALESGVRAPITALPTVVIALTAARFMSEMQPKTLQRVLERLRRGARAARTDETRLARDQIVGTSMRCAGPRCLERSLAVVFLCRLRGVWPDWCCGVATEPFRAHAWVEAEGAAVGEDALEISQLVPILRVSHQ